MKRPLRVVVLLVLVSLGTAFGGCQRSLFMGSDAYSRNVVKRYWDDDSARDTTAARERSSDMGFGFPSGMANQ